MPFQIVKNLEITGTISYDPSNSSNMSYIAMGDDYYMSVGILNATDQSITVTVSGGDSIAGTVPTQFGKIPLSNNPATVPANSNSAVSFNISQAYAPLIYVSIQVVGTVIPTGTINAYATPRPYIMKEMR